MAKRTIKEKLVDSITNDIINGVYSSDYVFTEKTLIEKYNVSRSPVRDALVELCSTEVLQSIPRYGYIIVPISERKIREITDMRLILEVEVFRRSLENCPEKVLHFIKEQNHMSEEASVSGMLPMRESWDRNMRFHLGLIELSGNQYIYDTIEAALNVIYRSYHTIYRGERVSDKMTNAQKKNHIVMEQLLEAGDKDGAVRSLEEDIVKLLNNSIL